MSRSGRVVFVLLAAFLASREARPDEDQARLREWIEGPIRYIALKDEAKLFRQLDSDEDRALFVERFWRRRDPSPETLHNEYRQMFWERVTQANGLFTDSSKRGWMTDRGKVFILYGAPVDIQEDIHLRTEGVSGGGHGIIRWIYDRPGARMDMDATVVVAFVRDGSGEYRVTYDPNLTSVFFDAATIRDARYDIAARKAAKSVGGGRSPLSVMLDLGKMQEVPPQDRVMLEHVETAEAYETEPLDVQVDRYQHPETGQTLLVITADLGSMNAEVHPAVVARLVPTAPKGDARVLGEDSFEIAEPAGSRVAQGRIAVGAGSYRVTVIVADPVRATTAMAQTQIEVTPPASGLSLSDVVLAAELEALPYRALISHDEPYVVGPYRVVPAVRSELRRGETLRLFFEAYGATLPLKVAYQLEGQERDGRWVALGAPSVGEQASEAQGWELPIGERWPLGAYRVRIEVTDSNGQRAATDAPFTLVDRGAS